MTRGQSTDSLWEETGWLVRVRYVSELMTAIGRIGTLELGRRFVWRGMRKASYTLQSSLQRHLSNRGLNSSEQDIAGAERELIEVARSWGVGDIGGVEMDDLQLLAVMQHHGVPTRLVDFTSNPMTAMWFACQQDPTTLENGILLALDVTDLRDGTSLASPEFESYVGGRLGSGLLRVVDESAARSSEPLLLESRAPDNRLRAQEGLFVLGAVPSEPRLKIASAFNLPHWPRKVDLRAHVLDPRSSGKPIRVPFVAISIPERIKHDMRVHLGRTYNRNRRYLFPDVDGLAEAVRSGDIQPLGQKPDANATPAS